MIFMSKAQSDIISALIIITIAIGLVSSAYMWGLPLIQKRQDAALSERVSNYFDQKNENSLPSEIEYVANNGGEQTFNLDVDGLWLLSPSENSISFTFFSRATNIGKDDWISLTTGATCPPSIGVIGIDKPSVVCARSGNLADGFNITYKVWFRRLNESSGIRFYEINLTQDLRGPLTSTGKNVRISRAGVSNIPLGGQTLINTEIKILFG
jgi:hypothetical protein